MEAKPYFLELPLDDDYQPLLNDRRSQPFNNHHPISTLTITSRSGMVCVGYACELKEAT